MPAKPINAAEKTFEDALRAFNSRDFPTAEKLFRKVLRSEPGHVAALNLLTVLLMGEERFGEAEPFIARAVRLNQQSDVSFYNYGLISKRLGKSDQALEHFTSALRLNASVAETWNNRGTVLNDLGRHSEALSDFDRAIALNPDYPEPLANKGRSLWALGHYEDALAAFDRALALKPDLAEAHLGRANLLRDTKRHAEAIAGYDRALALRPDLEGAWLGRGTACYETGRYDEALAAYDKALALKPDLAEAWLGRANASRGLGRYGEAVAAYRKAPALKPGFAEAWLGLGNISYEMRHYDEAFAAYDRALALMPDLAEAWLGRGNVFHETGDDDEALAAHDKALALKPELAGAWIGRGNVLAERERTRDALESFDKAIALDPHLTDGYFNKSLLKLSLGEYAEGWRLYEWRWKTQTSKRFARDFPQPLWLGETELNGKTILIHAEQGFGDTVQFARYLPLLKDKGCNIVLEVQKPLVALFKSQTYGGEIIATGDALPHFDVHCPLASLPLAFGTTIETIPASVPYLRPDSQKVALWQSRLDEGPGRRIGLVWSGNPNFRKDMRRSTQLATVLPALTEGDRWYALQKEIRAGDRTLLRETPSLRDLSERLVDFSDTAAVIAQLDLVVSTDTAVAHLAGALGKPVWILLSFHPDFRWFPASDTSLWYPTARLFRQAKDGEWDDVIARISRELRSSRAAATQS